MENKSSANSGDSEKHLNLLFNVLKLKEFYFTAHSFSILYHLNIGPMRNKDLIDAIDGLESTTLTARINTFLENGLIKYETIEKNGSEKHFVISEYAKQDIQKFLIFLKTFDIDYRKMMNCD